MNENRISYWPICSIQISFPYSYFHIIVYVHSTRSIDAQIPKNEYCSGEDFTKKGFFVFFTYKSRQYFAYSIYAYRSSVCFFIFSMKSFGLKCVSIDTFPAIDEMECRIQNVRAVCLKYLWAYAFKIFRSVTCAAQYFSISNI